MSEPKEIRCCTCNHTVAAAYCGPNGECIECGYFCPEPTEDEERAE